MGSCISKSKPKSSSPPPPPSLPLPLPPSKAHESCFVQDKLVIISSHPPQVPSPPSPSPSSASSSFPYTNTSVTSTITSCSSITSSSSSSSSISVSKDKSSSFSSSSSSSSSSYSNDYVWSCIKENPHLINQATLDKAHVIPQNSHTRKTEPSPTKSTLSSSSTKKQQSVVHSTPQKRACSSSKTTTTPLSPNIVSRQKSFRRDHLQQLPEVERCRHQLITTTTTTTSSVPAGKRNSNLGAVRYSSSPIRRSKGGNNDTCKGISRINSPGRKKILNHDDGHEELSIYKNTNKSNIKETTTRPVIRPSSPQPYKRNRDGMGSRKNQIITSTTTTTTHHIYDDDDDHQMDDVREEEAVLSSSCITDNHQEKQYYLNSAVVSSSTDDIDNPLISLDCFIFL